jgi:hypothetical protein
MSAVLRLLRSATFRVTYTLRQLTVKAMNIEEKSSFKIKNRETGVPTKEDSAIN